MTLQESQSDQHALQAENKVSDKELNFRAQQSKYEKLLAEERQAREELERKLKERSQAPVNDDDDDDEPYVDKKKLEKKLSRFSEHTKQYTQTEIQTQIQKALAEERKQQWISQNPDFYDVLKHAEKLVTKSPELAETILKMPEGFERQKLVYQNIKALDLDKPEPKQPSIQEKIDANRKSPYYQPSNISPSPYSQVSDFSEAGKKKGYDIMKDLQKRLRT